MARTDRIEETRALRLATRIGAHAVIVAAIAVLAQDPLPFADREVRASPTTPVRPAPAPARIAADAFAPLYAMHLAAASQ